MAEVLTTDRLRAMFDLAAEETDSRAAVTQQLAAHHTMRNVITNAVGGDKTGVEPEVHKHLLSPGDVLLMCSDGLSDMLSDEEIAQQLRKGPQDPEDLCGVLVGTANARGGTDNITVVIARFEGVAGQK